MEPTEVIIVEGILVLNNEELRKRMDIKVFVDTDSDERLMRIIHRDIAERGRTWEAVLRHYQTFVKPMHTVFSVPETVFNLCQARSGVFSGHCRLLHNSIA